MQRSWFQRMRAGAWLWHTVRVGASLCDSVRVGASLCDSASASLWCTARDFSVCEWLHHCGTVWYTPTITPWCTPTDAIITQWSTHNDAVISMGCTHSLWCCYNTLLQRTTATQLLQYTTATRSLHNTATNVYAVPAQFYCIYTLIYIPSLSLSTCIHLHRYTIYTC